MAEDIDIDIEEHDLLKNPAIQRIFPDLSVLKQEIMDFDQGFPEEPENFKETYNNILFDKFNNTTGNVAALGSKAQSNVANNFQTKIILGSKPHKPKNEFKFYLKKDVKVILQNIAPYLTRTMRFCDVCLTLFPHKGSLNDHKLTAHPSLHHSSKEDIPVSENKKGYKCVLCDVRFTTQGSLRRHNKNVHNINQRNKEETINSLINEHNAMDKTYDLQTHHISNVCKPCFHCEKLFPNQQDLIDHLYTILYAKKAQVTLENIGEKEIKQEERSIDKSDVHLQKNENAITYLDIDSQRKVNESQSIYSCPICSYYFIEEMFYRSHVIVKHKVMKNMQIDKSSFNPMCKFCNVKYDDILSYNAHLRKSHKIEMLKSFDSVLQSYNVGARQSNSYNLLIPKATTVDINSKHGQLSASVNNSEKQDSLKPIYDNIRVAVSKILLFKCSECDIHFVTSDAAFKHFNHLESQKNWECKNCNRLFQDKDANVHEKQHKYSNYFKTVKIYAETQPRILYKCLMCSVHFSSKGKISEHCSICELEHSRSTESWYCKICDILIESSTNPSHKEDHTVNNFTPADFKIIDIQSPILKNISKNHSKNCCDDPYKLVKPSIDSKNPGRKNIKNKHNNVKISKSLSAKTNLTYNYCNVCKCNICRVYKTDVHLRLLCVNIVKCICKYCGLMFSNISITSHRRLHHNYKALKLQDFTFYNLQTNKLMKPLIPEFPKCELCEKHFISKVEMKGHLCVINSNIICSICKLKFSETAYKLHLPFHSYKLKSRIKLSNELIDKDESRHDLNKMNGSILSSKDIIPVIYTCKNCNVSMSKYDEVIEHCHLHTNLNKVEVNAVECSTCQIKFVDSSYNKHEELHKNLKILNFRRIYFDVVYFGSDNNKWLKHIFKSLCKYKVNKLIWDSIYKYETRIKMAVIQEGPSNFIIYKCEKCQCIIDCNSTYSHIATCCPSSEISDCTFCDLSFSCSMTRNNHEKIHATSDITMNSYRIVVFNREQDRNVNYNISNFKKCYVVYQCRYCHVLVESYNYTYHICFRNDSTKCNVCGLLLFAENINEHILKHKLVPSFNENKIKVVLLGSKMKENAILQKNNILEPSFNGIVCDYTFYKCIDCEVCVRDVRNTVQHSCLIDAAKSQCIKCDLIFDEGKLKGHLKLHDTDPDFTRETILVKPFTNRKPSESVYKHNETFAFGIEINGKSKNENTNHIKTTSVQARVNTITAKLYKCSCGLHYVQQSSLEEHMKKCSGKNKSVQNCSKCCLSFTSDVLFKHLLEHHGDKNVIYKYEIVDNLKVGHLKI
ncbi:zinc finger protein 845-like [Pararge aegeria]|uniref:zinc finger protein 845-like n=1 Tax=Pararge aegeria TaxID=116150 RepID=UPI0019D292A4|nr:zinc finger protein 845-like [Pararge aegeria]XP_039765608.1 zinc finger protein 845-like [Pararge aegeria]